MHTNIIKYLKTITFVYLPYSPLRNIVYIPTVRLCSHYSFLLIDNNDIIYMTKKLNILLFIFGTNHYIYK